MPATAMSSRERMLAAIRREPVDRVPTDIWATPEIMRRLHDRYGSDEALRRELHIDGFASAGPRYVGPPIPTNLASGETADLWGMRRRRVDYGSGAYDEQFHFPLAEAKTIDDLEAYAWPLVEWFDFSAIKSQLEKLHEAQAVQCGYMAPFFYHNLLRGLEASLMDPFDDPDFTHNLVQRISDFFYDYHRRLFEVADGLIDVSQVTDDLGSQTGPLISLDVYREFYRPHHERFVRLCHEFGILAMHHDDGAIRDFLPDLVGMGIDLLNPIQWRCPGMDPRGLKRDFGDRIAFHGAIDNQQTLPHGTPDEVRAEVREMIDILAADRTGYVLAPCHCIQPVTPMENIVAMYDEAHRYGVFD